MTLAWLQTFEYYPRVTDMTTQEKFIEFHRLNPQVADILEDMADELISRGRKRVGIKMLMEVLRWNYQMKTDDPNSDFKINNNYAPHYSRLLLSRHPNWENVFELRELRSE